MYAFHTNLRGIAAAIQAPQLTKEQEKALDLLIKRWGNVPLSDLAREIKKIRQETVQHGQKEAVAKELALAIALLMPAFGSAEALAKAVTSEPSAIHQQDSIKAESILSKAVLDSVREAIPFAFGAAEKAFLSATPNLLVSPENAKKIFINQMKMKVRDGLEKNVKPLMEQHPALKNMPMNQKVELLTSAFKEKLKGHPQETRMLTEWMKKLQDKDVRMSIDDVSRIVDNVTQAEYQIRSAFLFTKKPEPEEKSPEDIKTVLERLTRAVAIQPIGNAKRVVEDQLSHVLSLREIQHLSPGNIQNIALALRNKDIPGAMEEIEMIGKRFEGA